MAERLHVDTAEDTPDGVVYVGPGSVWASPYDPTTPPPLWPAGRRWTPGHAAEAYRSMLAGGVLLNRPPGRRIVLDAMEQLVGVDVACTCPEGQPCHGDALLDYATSPNHQPPTTEQGATP